MECKYCSKFCHNLNSLSQHELRCKLNPERRSYDNFSKYIRESRKGKTKDNCDEIRRAAESLKEGYSSGRIVPYYKGKTGTFLGKTHSEDTKKRIGKTVSESRKEGYRNGSITPALGVGKGVYSKMLYKGKTYTFRSTYEFIYALYLAHLGVDFSLEDTRVPNTSKDKKYSNTFISDFRVGNTIIEIKDRPCDKVSYEKESFINAGYRFVEIYNDKIEVFQKLLSSKGYNIEDIIKVIVEHDKKKDYYIYNFDKTQAW